MATEIPIPYLNRAEVGARAQQFQVKQKKQRNLNCLCES
jgi:hypothetical protein